MKSSGGEHYIALDHIRAVAAFMVVCWHFTHHIEGYPAPYDGAPLIFPFALLDEGHTGVSLFMVLSGYLFAKLLNGKSINYGAFLWNRALRLLPLLILVLIIRGFRNQQIGIDQYTYWSTIVQGLVFPVLPNGGWSITVEFHFYLLLPLFLWMFRKSRYLPFVALGLALVLRIVLYKITGETQSLSYWTILGRVDQFLLGMLAFQFRAHFARRNLLVAFLSVFFVAFYWWFDYVGGFYKYQSYPSHEPLWIFLPTIEGVAYCAFIAWYDTSFKHRTNGFSGILGRAGEYSYSIYLMHTFAVFQVARFIDVHVMDISNFYFASAWALLFYGCMMPVGYLTYRFVEKPFLQLRKKYIRVDSTVNVGLGTVRS